MLLRSPVKAVLCLVVLCCSVGWMVCCGGTSYGTGSPGGPNPNPSPTPNPTPTPAAHSVSVSWQASSSPGVATYNVYRSTVSGGPYTRVGWGVSGATFTDSGVQAGATYFYVVTAVTNANVESTISSEIKATVPTP